MHVDEFRSSNFLKALDLQPGKRYRMKILNLHPQELPNQKKPKPAAELSYNGRVLKKEWIVNSTNLDTMTEAYGPLMDNWINEEVWLFSERTMYQGKSLRGIRCEPIRRSASKTTPAEPDPKEQRQSDGLDGAGMDDIEDDLLDDPGVPGEEDQL